MEQFIRLGIIGLGQRGMGLLKEILLLQQDVKIIAICDLYEDRCLEAVNLIQASGRSTPHTTLDYKELLAMEQVDTVLVSSAWEAHIDIACDAMRAGKIVGFEVGGAYSIEDCWRLIRTYEETGTPCSMLENTCYGRNELMVLNMVRKGLLGQVVHCSGGYRHDLRKEVSLGRENRHYRFRNYLHRCCDNYPTHDLGPIASILNINHGNRMLSLVSMASKAAGLHEYIEKNIPHSDAAELQFAQGDVVTTIIKCAHGETIVLTLDTTLPRPYSRGFHVQGTKGMFEEDNCSVFLDGKDDAFEFSWSNHWNNASEYQKEFDHPIWKAYLRDGVKGAHDGIDWLTVRSFIDAAKVRKSAPIDVYDAAAWMSISALTEESIAQGGMPVAIPDFTCGKWLLRPQWEP